jgi:hypothetical protein
MEQTKDRELEIAKALLIANLYSGFNDYFNGLKRKMNPVLKQLLPGDVEGDVINLIFKASHKALNILQDEISKKKKK